MLNLAHRNSNSDPMPMPHGEKTKIRLVLDAMGYRFGPGHRIRLSLSTAYWPMILPSPENPGLTIDTNSISLELPELGAHQVVNLPEPSNPDPLPKYKQLAEGAAQRLFEHDLHAGVTRLKLLEDTGLFEHPETGLATRQLREELWEISTDDPLSARGTCTWTCTMQRPGWSVHTITTTTLSCTKQDWLIAAKVSAFEGETMIFEREFPETRIARDFM